MGDSNDAVRKGETCESCPEIKADLREVKTLVTRTGADITELKTVIKEVFQKLDNMFVSVSHHDAALAILAEKVKAEAALMTEQKVQAASVRNLVLGAIISFFASVVVVYVASKIK
jgi:hypothetical protein